MIEHTGNFFKCFLKNAAVESSIKRINENDLKCARHLWCLVIVCILFQIHAQPPYQGSINAMPTL